MFKFLDPAGCTRFCGRTFVYNIPGRGERYAITEHPTPAKPDGIACGPGRLHVMKKLDARYAPLNWWPWWCIGIGPTIGEDYEKVGFAAVRLRRISPRVLWRVLRPPFNWGYQTCLEAANFSEAILNNAVLKGTNLIEADLSRADLSAADLSAANLTRANLTRANLDGTNLTRANMHKANLSGANLTGANLTKTILSMIAYDKHTVWPKGFW